LVKVMEEAKGTVTDALPDIENSSGQIEELVKTMKSQKTNLRMLEKQLNVTSRERDAVLMRMGALQRDVSDIEALLDIVEKSRDLVSQNDDDYYEKINKANSCIQVNPSWRPMSVPSGFRCSSSTRSSRLAADSLLLLGKSAVGSSQCSRN